MTQPLWSAVDGYLADVLVGHDPVLEAALADSAAAGLPAIAVAPNQGKLLFLLARAARARRILEVGTLGGYSTIWLARGLEPGGRVVSLELEEKHARVARANLARAGLTGAVDVLVGPALASMERLAAERAGGAPPFDLVFLDADKEGYPAYLEWSLRLARPGALIVADNVVREGAVVDRASRDAMVRGVRAFLEQLGRDPRVSATALQTVGVKGHDGLAIAVVNGVGDGRGSAGA